MSLSESIHERRLRRRADHDLTAAKNAARKAIDIKDPRFLGEAAFAATRGPAGLAWFAAGKGLQARREHVAASAESATEALRKSGVAVPKLRSTQRHTPWWAIGFLSALVISGGAAGFLALRRKRNSTRDSAPSASTPTTSEPATQPEPVNEEK